MLPVELAAIKAKLIEHMKAADESLLKKVRSDRFYEAEADVIVKLTGVAKPLKLRFPLAFMDFETTGLSPQAKPIQLGSVIVDKDLTKKDHMKFMIDSIGFSDLLHREYWSAQKIHRQKFSDIRNGLRPIEVTRQLDVLPGKYPGLLIAGQNVGFDFSKLKKLYQLAGQPMPFDYHLVDLTGLAVVHQGVKSLGEIAKVLDQDVSRYTKHDALGDAELTADCFIELMRRL